ncbi:CshA/CshB family fibrillar adhesin-related protein [uncultured Propionibacterium sp.]|uniref:CshA/CshB family fibrillar adhesin-related protein n=1 Tax=uncultured Propionibacterium sp. TaxID=218066 RepID=UPI0029303168|nr:CshA/CshB family fibrillar adhesin-related protein [uncultured Propionibacterium sp.]
MSLPSSTRTGLRGRVRTAMAGVCAASTLLGMVSAAPPAAAAPDTELPAVYATGGDGRFKDAIQWLQWSDYPLAANAEDNTVLGYGDQFGPSTRTVTNYRYLDDEQTLKLTTTCTLSGLVTDNEGQANGDAPAVRRAPLVATVPGKWAGDALDNLYNVGGSGHWENGQIARSGNQVYPTNYVNDNRMVIGLSNGFADNGNSGIGYGSRMSFDMQCSASLNGQEVPLSGLVLADAEASSAHSPRGYRDEWVQATATQGSGTSWRVLDTYKDPNCPVTTQAVVSDGGNTVQLIPTGEECVYQNGGRYRTPEGIGGPDAVLFMQGSTQARISMQGRGYSAVALGLVVGTDFGDAPASYGRASSLFQPTWTGGQITRTTDAFSVDRATMSAADTRLGASIDSEGDQKFSAGADGDDLSGIDDEDGVTPPADGIRTQPGARYAQEVSCTGPGRLAGWVDWNRDGRFDESTEKSDEQSCPSSGRATLSWTVPDDVVRSVADENATSYMRVRITNDAGTLTATGNTRTGEVEDYAVDVRVPTLRLVKEVDAAQAADEQSLAPESWSLTAATGGQDVLSGQGSTDEVVVAQGRYTVAESSGDSRAQAYELSSTVCANSDGQQLTTSGTDGGAAFELTGYDRVTCTFTNAASQGSASWAKVDAADEQPLGGTVWTLTGPSHPGGTEVEDCVADDAASCTGLDTDPGKGSLTVTGLMWGQYTLREKSAPEGYELNPNTYVLTVNDSSLTARPDSAVPDERKDAAVRWAKTAADGSALGGSAWTLEPIDPAGAAMTVEDCSADSADDCTGPDKDPAAGAFLVEGLDWGGYELKERSAPAGYVLSEDVHAVRIEAANAGTTIDLGSFTNEMHGPLVVPLTGGRSAQLFLLIGGALLGVGAMTVAVRRRRARMSARG